MKQILKLLTVLSPLLLNPPLFAGEASSSAGLSHWPGDAAAVVTSPLRWDGGDYAKFGLAAGSVGLAFALFDDSVEDYARNIKKTPLNEVSETMRNFGDGLFVVPIFGGSFLYGGITHDEGLKRAGLIGLESYLISGALVTVVKYSVHRPRPKTLAGFQRVHEQNFFSRSNVSFPSGHSASAFSTARVVSWYFRDYKAVPYLCYSMAGLVAWSRVNETQHWPSDVVAGSLIGYFVADKVIKLNDKRSGEGSSAALLPFYGQAPGLTALYRF
jgi:hypothetical protein